MALLAVALAGLVWMPTIADGTEAKYNCVVWFYSEDGTALFFTRTATPGETLGEVLDGDLPAIGHWVDISTGYEYHKEQKVTKDLMVRASTATPPQAPTGSEADISTILIWLVVAGLAAFVFGKAALSYRRT